MQLTVHPLPADSGLDASRPLMLLAHVPPPLSNTKLAAQLAVAIAVLLGALTVVTAGETPGGPVGPVGPVAPFGPGGPCAPVAPVRPWQSRASQIPSR